jgi:CDP-glycerol glycerophosphotransferase (TagB/SpsB family)
LITDFSSVAFDFMFQDKPVIFYLLDKEDNGLHELDKSDIDNFDFKKFLIPNVCFEEQEVINLIKKYVENDFKLEKDVKAQYDKFFYTKSDIRAKLTKELDEICG